MPRYAITEKAGRFVAGYRNNGVGTVLELTEKQAAFDLRSGALVDLAKQAKATEAAKAKAAADTAKAEGGKGGGKKAAETGGQ